MTIWDLYEYLQKEGHEKLLQKTQSGFSILDHTIERTDNGIRVCNKGQGETIETHFKAADEAEACYFYYTKVSGGLLYLCHSTDASYISVQQAILENAGIAVWRRDIPHCSGPETTRYRIFVDGTDLMQAQALLTASRGLSQ